MGFMTKGQKKKFNKMSKEARKKAMELAINSQVSKVLAQNVSKSMIDGMDLQSSHLYKKYVDKIDSGALSEEQKQETIEALLSAIRMGHLRYVKKHGDLPITWKDEVTEEAMEAEKNE